MLETINALRQVETGEYNGIGRKLVVLGNEVTLPNGLVKPERDNGLGVVSKYLGVTTLDMARDVNVNLTSPIENGKIIDKRMLAWLLIGREQRDDASGLGGEQFVPAAIDIVSKAIRTTADIAGMNILQGGKKSATNWRSLFEGLVKADVFGKDFQPTIVTSLGGSDGDVPLAAPFNVLPGLELGVKLRESGYTPNMIVTSAAKYGSDCNGLDLDRTSRNWRKTLGAYQRLVDEFYPEAENDIAYETLSPSGLDAYPDWLISAARECCNEDPGLQSTAEQYGAGPEAFVRYMLSHTQAFRDFQLVPKAPFVIKVGAPSEERFSRWQKRVIERAMPIPDGFAPNMVLNGQANDSSYGQTSLYYSRLGNRPPYYPDDAAEPSIYESSFPIDYQDFLETIPIDNPCLKRYDDLGTALKKTCVPPNEYLKLFLYEK